MKITKTNQNQNVSRFVSVSRLLSRACLGKSHRLFSFHLMKTPIITHTRQEFIGDGGEISHRERSVLAAAGFELAAIPHPISVTRHNLRVNLRLNIPHTHGPAHQIGLVSQGLPMFVPRLSWQNDRFELNKRGSNKGVFSPIRRAAKDLRFARRLEHAAVPYPTLTCSKKFQKLNAAESARASERERESGGTRRHGRASHRVAEGVLVVAAGGAILAGRIVFVAQQIHEATVLLKQIVRVSASRCCSVGWVSRACLVNQMISSLSIRK